MLAMLNNSYSTQKYEAMDSSVKSYAKNTEPTLPPIHLKLVWQSR